jgi:nucleoside triphosphatase YtkD
MTTAKPFSHSLSDPTIIPKERLLQTAGPEQIRYFVGAAQETIELVLFPKIPADAQHVAAIAIYHNQLLMIHHQTRGIEWPGGRVEANESPLQAMFRETLEETGATVRTSAFIATYSYLLPDNQPFIKHVYLLWIDQLPDHYEPQMDSAGYLLMPLDQAVSLEAGFSIYVTDGVFDAIRQAIGLIP